MTYVRFDGAGAVVEDGGPHPQHNEFVPQSARAKEQMLDSKKFDFLTKSVVMAASRRQAIRGIVAGLAAAVLGRAGLEPAAAQLSADACVGLRKSCKKKPGEPKPRCCGRLRCRGGRCRCGNNTRQCGGECITRRQCCRDRECGPEGRCNNNRCSCPGSGTTCNGQCVNTDSSPNNCGICDRDCANDQGCIGGECVDDNCVPYEVSTNPNSSNVERVDGGVILRATDASQPEGLTAGAVRFAQEGPVDFGEIGRLGLEYTIAEGSCLFGGIRFSLLTDADPNDGNPNVFVDIGPDTAPDGPAGPCPVGTDTDTGNLVESTAERFFFRNEFQKYTAAELEAILDGLGAQITGIVLVADSSGAPRTEVFVNPCVRFAEPNNNS